MTTAKDKIEQKCIGCGKITLRPPYSSRKYKYCSSECYHKYKGSISFNNEQLLNVKKRLDSGEDPKDIAREYSVDLRTLRKAVTELYKDFIMSGFTQDLIVKYPNRINALLKDFDKLDCVKVQGYLLSLSIKHRIEVNVLKRLITHLRGKDSISKMYRSISINRSKKIAELHINGKSTEEISDILGISPTLVRDGLHALELKTGKKILKMSGSQKEYNMDIGNIIKLMKSGIRGYKLMEYPQYTGGAFLTTIYDRIREYEKKTGDKVLKPQRIGFVRFGGWIMIQYHNHPYSNGRGYVFLHKLLLENHVGQYLSNCDMDVHHCDGNKMHNLIDNYSYLTRSEHNRISRICSVMYEMLSKGFNCSELKVFKMALEKVGKARITDIREENIKNGTFEVLHEDIIEKYYEWMATVNA